MTRDSITKTAAGLVLAALALAGCGRRDDLPSPRVAEGAAMAPDAAADTTAQAARDAARVTRLAAEAARAAAKNAADQATDKVADALITTSIRAEFASDPALSGLPIDVDTDNGRVALHGRAPDEAAKARATELAAAVDGVVSVENWLTVDGAG